MTSARAAVTGIDAKALSPFISGEESILEDYDAEIEEASAEGTTRDMLTGQKSALSAKIAEMKSIKAPA